MSERDESRNRLQAILDTAVDGIATLAHSIGFDVRGEIESPLRGPAGNVEFLLHLVMG